MASDARPIPIVVYDASVLYPLSLRNVLVQCAADRLVHARWTDDIHEEWMRNLLARRPGLTRERLERTRRLMDQAVPDALVRDHRHLIPSISLPDPDDRHVVAGAIKAGAEAIVTTDRHFRGADLGRHGLAARHPDGFLVALHRADPELMVAAMAGARRNLGRSVPTSAEFLAGLRRTGVLDAFADALQRHLADL